METNCPQADVTDQHLVANWNPLISMNQSVHFDESSPFATYNVRLSQDQEINSSQISSFGNERFPEILTSFEFPHGCHLVTDSNATDFPSSNQQVFEKNLKGKKRKGVLGCDTVSSLHDIENVEAEQSKDISSESITGKDDVKQNMKPASMTHSYSKNTKGQLQDGSNDKDDYIHVRAKRGQATNSHSLAERVRRERISQRMKLLQDLVPGCNKITGKAVMLDEVINYVQSLQCQVEFLSMKLAAVNPAINVDIEQILSKDMFQLRSRNSAMPSFTSRLANINNSQFCESSLMRVMQPEAMSGVQDSENMLRTYLANVPNTTQLSNLWDDELQNVAQMNYMSNVPSRSMEQHGS